MPPVFLNDYWLHVLVVGFYYVVLASSWNLLSGYTGQFSMGHHALSAVGAYSAGFLAVYLGIPPLTGILIGGVAGMIASFLIGILVLRMSSIYLAVTTWALAETLRMFLIVEYKLTRGYKGLRVGLLFRGTSMVPYYYTALLMVFATVLVIYTILNSRFGLYLKAIRDDEDAASAMGVDVVKWKVFAFSVSGLIAGFAGAFYGFFMGVLSPALVGFQEMALIAIVTVLGGYGTILGPVIGGITVQYLSESLRAYGELRMILFAFALILTMAIWRGGLIGIIKRLKYKFQELS